MLLKLPVFHISRQKIHRKKMEKKAFVVRLIHDNKFNDPLTKKLKMYSILKINK